MISGREALSRVLDCVAEGARPSIDRALGSKSSHGDWVAMIEMRDEVRTKRPHRHSASDPAFLLRILTEEWRSFTPNLDFEQRALATELRTAATKWSRGESFSRADAQRAADTAARLLDSLNTEQSTLAALAARAIIPQIEGDAPDNDTSVAVVIEGADGAIEDLLSDSELARVIDAWRERTGHGHVHIAAPSLEVEVEFHKAVNFGLAHNGVSPLIGVTVRNTGTEEQTIASLEFSLLAGEALDLGAPWVLGPVTVPAQSERHIPVPLLRWSLNAAVFATIVESTSARLRGVLITLDSRHEIEDSVTLLAADEWWAGSIPESLAAFVMQRDPAVESLLTAAAQRLEAKTRDRSLNGYEAGAERAIAIAGAVWDELCSLNLSRRVDQTAGDGLAHQVRRPADVVASGSATDIEVAALYAAAIERAGLNPVLVVGRRLAMAGVMVSDSQLPLVAIDDGPTLQNFVESTILWPVDTGAALGTGSADLKHAVDAARDWMRTHTREIDFILDVRRAHRRVRPLPVLRVVDGAVVVEVEQQAARVFEHRPQDNSRYESRTEAIPARVASWRNSLLDLTFRNPLLNMKTQRSGLDLAVPHGYLGALEDLLARGTSFTISTSDDVGALQVASGTDSTMNLPDHQLAAIMEGEHLLYSHVPSAQYYARTVTLMRKAKTVFEETGANNLYLALGSLVWDDAGRQARAPLFLLPVTLKGRRGQLVKIQVEDGAVAVANQCLLEKLRVSKQLVVPALANPLEDGAGIDVDDALAQLRFALLDAGLPFKVEETAHLAVFQFSTLQLWQDVSDNWQSFMANPVVKHLVETPTDTFQDPVPEPTMDAHAEVTEFLPVAADGSQIEAVRWAAAGRSFVLEGPPGTGKSQTITNVIANSLAKGKRVLFVAEKQAALDVVKRRLEAVGLAPYCLDLHGRNQGPSDVRAQLREALYAQVGDVSNFINVLGGQQTSMLTQLDRYPTLLHEQGPSGLSAWHALQAALTLESILGRGDVADIALDIARDGSRYESACDAARELGEGVQDLGTPVSSNTWTLAGAPTLDGSSREKIAEAVRSLETALAGFTSPQVRALTALATQHRDFEFALAYATYAARGIAPDPAAVADFVDSAWLERATDLRAEVAQVVESALPLTAVLMPAVMRDNGLDDLLAAARQADKGLFKGGKRKKVIERLKHLVRAGFVVEPQTLTATLELALSSRMASDALRLKVADDLRVDLDPSWNPLEEGGEAALWDRVQATYAAASLAAMGGAAIEAARGLTGPARPSMGAGTEVDSFSFGEDLVVPREVPQAATAAASDGNAGALRHAWVTLLAALDSRPSDVTRWAGERGILAAIYGEIPTWVTDASSLAFVRLGRWSKVQLHARQLEQWGAEEWVAQVRAGTIIGEDAETAFRLAAARAALRERLEAAGFVGFDGRQRERHVMRYAETSRDLRNALVDHLPSVIVKRRSFTVDRLMGRVGELDRELGRKRGGASVRKLMTDFGSVIGEITPCLLMSPHSVARFLPPGSVDIDVVVFDEASQIRVAEAVGAMGRGRSVVVVGDSRQMPPTEFGGGDFGGEEDNDADDALAPVDQESILTEAVESRLPRLWLSWHYRSRDESLITFSNRYYYEGRLSSFPAPPRENSDLGISWRRVDGSFERGKRRVNRAEAEAVVEEISRILAARPTASIGVVTFNVEQRDLVLDLLEASKNQLIEQALARPDDALFVKNLENVQGDERDIILFTLAFSPDPVTGKLPLNFGPLNRSGGERRLNVAITRARERVVLFSSFTPEHIELDRTSSVGLEHLRDYLAVAAFGFEGAAAMRLAAQKDIYRARIAQRLRERGLEVREQVGLSDFTVDLAARRSGGDWIAVLLDTPAWAARKTVADREVLPQAVLRNSMGWSQVVKVWLPSWVYEPEVVVDDIVAAANGERSEPLPVDDVRHAPEDDAAGSNGSAVTAGSDASGDRAGELDAEETAGGEAEDAQVDGVPSGRGEPGEGGAKAESTVGIGGYATWRPASAVPVAGAILADLDRFGYPVSRKRVEREVLDVIAAEAPLSRERLAKTVANRVGLTRVSPYRVQQIGSLVPHHQVHSTVMGVYVFPEGVTPLSYDTFRPAPPGTRRDLVDVAPHEILNAMKYVAIAGHGALVDEVFKETAAIFGYSRLTAPVRESLRQVLELAQSGALLEVVDGRVFGPAAHG